MIEVYERDEIPEELYRQPFAAMDPGEHGGVLGFRDPTTMVEPIAHALDACDILRVLETAQANILVLERQYVTDPRRARSVIDLTWRCGIVLGEMHTLMLRRRGVSALRIVRVAPSTWYAHQRAQEGINGRGEKGQGIKIARQRARPALASVERYRAAPKIAQDGYHAAYGIAEWWGSVAWGER